MTPCKNHTLHWPGVADVVMEAAGLIFGLALVLLLVVRSGLERCSGRRIWTSGGTKGGLQAGRYGGVAIIMDRTSVLTLVQNIKASKGGV